MGYRGSERPAALACSIAFFTSHRSPLSERLEQATAAHTPPPLPSQVNVRGELGDPVALQCESILSKLAIISRKHILRLHFAILLCLGMAIIHPLEGVLCVQGYE